jgi:hypothetical protein
MQLSELSTPLKAQNGRFKVGPLAFRLRDFIEEEIAVATARGPGQG